MGGFVQNTVQLYPNARYEGQIDTATVGANSGSHILRGSDVGFGLAVVQGTSDIDVKVATATGGVFRGVTVRNLDVNNSEGTKQALYKEDRPVTIRNFGHIIVKTEVAVDRDDPVYFRHTASGDLTTLGAFRNDADTNKADAITGAYFTESAGAGELVRICLPRFY